MPMFNKLVRVVIYPEELPSINFHESLIISSFEVTRQIKYIISPLAEDLWIQNQEGVDLPWESPTFKVTWPFNHMATVMSRNESKKKFLHFHKTYDHQTLQGAEAIAEFAQNANAQVVTNFFFIQQHLVKISGDLGKISTNRTNLGAA